MQASARLHGKKGTPALLLPAGWSATYQQQSRTAASAVVAPAPTQGERHQAKSVHGFDLVRDEFVAEYDSQVLTFRHSKTGADTDSLISHLGPRSGVNQTVENCSNVTHANMFASLQRGDRGGKKGERGGAVEKGGDTSNDGFEIDEELIISHMSMLRCRMSSHVAGEQ